jgi:hypothetical protein
MTNQGVGAMAKRSNRQKDKKTRKLWQKTRRKVNCIKFDCWVHPSNMTYIYIGSMT